MEDLNIRKVLHSHNFWKKWIYISICFKVESRRGSELLRAHQNRAELGAALYSSTAPSLHPRSYSYQARFKVQKGIYLTILDEACVSKIAVLRETNLQDCNPAQRSRNQMDKSQTRLSLGHCGLRVSSSQAKIDVNFYFLNTKANHKYFFNVLKCSCKGQQKSISELMR